MRVSSRCVLIGCSPRFVCFSAARGSAVQVPAVDGEQFTRSCTERHHADFCARALCCMRIAVRGSLERPLTHLSLALHSIAWMAVCGCVCMTTDEAASRDEGVHHPSGVDHRKQLGARVQVQAPEVKRRHTDSDAACRAGLSNDSAGRRGERIVRHIYHTITIHFASRFYPTRHSCEARTLAFASPAGACNCACACWLQLCASS